MHCWIHSLVLAVALAGTAHAQMDAATQAKLDAAMRQGKEINDHDQSAWHVTDALMAAVPEAKNKRVAYVTERVDADLVKTTFLLLGGDTPKVYFAGVTKGSDVVSIENFTKRDDAPAATADQIARINATSAVMQALKDGVCGKGINTVILPAEKPGELYAYALVAETEDNIVQMGGHLRMTFGADGKLVSGSVKKYSNSCIAMPYTKDLVGLMVTLPANIGDTPTELHVFESLSHNLPLYVGAVDRVWEVAGGKIELLKE